MSTISISGSFIMSCQSAVPLLNPRRVAASLAHSSVKSAMEFVLNGYDAKVAEKIKESEGYT